MNNKKTFKSNESESSIVPSIMKMLKDLRLSCESAWLENCDDREAVKNGEINATEANEQRNDRIIQLTDQKHNIVDAIKANKMLNSLELSKRLEDKVVPDIEDKSTLKPKLN